MKYMYPLKICPWCKCTPELYMIYNLETWLPEIRCKNTLCTVQPKTKYIPIRKIQKKDPNIIKSKIERLIDYWNNSNPMIAKEGIELDFNLIAQEKQEKQLV